LSPAVLAASHGTSSLAGRTAVRMLVERVASSLRFPVVACHVDVEQPDVPSALAMAAETCNSAVIVPLLLSAGYHVYVDLTESAERSPVPTLVAPALGPDARLVAVLSERLREAGHGLGDSVVLAAAGSSDERAVADCRTTARMLADELDTPVQLGFISACEPALSDAVADARRSRPTARVVIATYLLAPGYFTDLAGKAGADVVAEPLLTPRSTPEELVLVVVDRVAATIRSA
jgi:sirohydrochlorin ferrochelatase